MYISMECFRSLSFHNIIISYRYCYSIISLANISRCHITFELFCVRNNVLSPFFVCFASFFPHTVLHGVLSVFLFHCICFHFIDTILKLHVVMFVQFYPHTFCSASIPFSIQLWIVIGFATICWTLRRICHDYIDAIGLLLWISIFILKRWIN